MSDSFFSLFIVSSHSLIDVFDFRFARFCSIFRRFSILSSSLIMFSVFIPISKHFWSRHRWQNRRVTTVISQLSLNGHCIDLADRALRRKNALQLSHVIALKLHPSALSPHTWHTLSICDIFSGHSLTDGPKNPIESLKKARKSYRHSTI